MGLRLGLGLRFKVKVRGLESTLGLGLKLGPHSRALIGSATAALFASSAALARSVASSSAAFSIFLPDED